MQSPITIETTQWNRLREMFAQAMVLDPDDRELLLDSLDTREPQLRPLLIDLLDAHDHAAGQTDEVRDDLLRNALELSEPDVSGLRVGNYELKERIGLGGMGVVYRAQRADGQVSQAVAIKLMRRTLIGSTALRRFRQERDVIAGLKHPYIAQLFDPKFLSYPP